MKRIFSLLLLLGVLASMASAAVTLTVPTANVTVGTSYRVTVTQAPPQGANAQNYVVTLKSGTTVLASGPVSVYKDVIQTTPGSVSYTAVGWDGSTVTQSVTIVSSNLPPQGVFESTNSPSYTGQTLTATGWAGDPELGTVSRVDIFVDGVDVGDATLGLARADIATSTGRSNYANAGWTFSWSTSGLSSGMHTVSATAVDAVGQTTTLGSSNFTLQSGAPVTLSFSALRSTFMLGATAKLSALTTDPTGDLVLHTIDAYSPSTQTWASQASWSGSSTSSNTLNATAVLNATGVWSFRARGVDSKQAAGAYFNITLTVTPTDTTTDTDLDGIPDYWEIQNGLDPYDASDANADPDGDSYTNLQEFVFGLNPRQSNSTGVNLKLLNVSGVIRTISTTTWRVQ